MPRGGGGVGGSAHTHASDMHKRPGWRLLPAQKQCGVELHAKPVPGAPAAFRENAPARPRSPPSSPAQQPALLEPPSTRPPHHSPPPAAGSYPAAAQTGKPTHCQHTAPVLRGRNAHSSAQSRWGLPLLPRSGAAARGQLLLSRRLTAAAPATAAELQPRCAGRARGPGMALCNISSSSNSSIGHD